MAPKGTRKSGKTDIPGLASEVFGKDKKNRQAANSDEDFGRITKRLQIEFQYNRINRGKLYTELCETFVSRWKIRTILIEIYKALFLILLGCACYLSGKELFRIVQQILIYSNRSGVSRETLQLGSDSIVAIVTAFVSFTSAILVLPKQIGNYLFNKDENKDAVDIIKQMAEMDMGNDQGESGK